MRNPRGTAWLVVLCGAFASCPSLGGALPPGVPVKPGGVPKEAWEHYRRLHAGDYDERRRAAILLAEMGEQAAPLVPLLVQNLAGSGARGHRLPPGYYSVQDAASTVLAGIGEPAVRPLVAVLRDVGLETAALRVLARIGEPSVKPLCAALPSLRGRVRAEAVRTLGVIGHAAATDALIQALRADEYETRSQAAIALGKIEAEKAVGPLIAALTDEDCQVRHHVVVALGQIGDPRAVVPLLEQTHPGRSEIVTALVAIGRPAAEPLLAALDNERFRYYAAKALARFREPPVEGLIRKLRAEDSRVRRTVAELLGKAHDPRGVPALTAALGDTDDRTAATAALALGEIGDRRAIGPLRSAVKGERRAVRACAAMALGQIGDRGSVELLLAALADEKCPIRPYAARALGRIGDKRAVEPLLAALGEPGQLRREAVDALGRLNDARAIKPLVAFLGDSTNDAGDAAVTALIPFRQAAVEPLIAALADREPLARANACKALGEIGDYRAVEPLIPMLGEQGPRTKQVRRAALEALRRITTQTFDADPARWREWWAQNKGQFLKRK